MIIRNFSPEWKLWVWSNIVNGLERESLFNVLLNYGFDYNLIKGELEIEPTNASIWQRQYSQTLLNQPHDIDLIPFYKPICDNPNAYRVETNLVEMYRIPDFLRYDECEKVIEMMEGKYTETKAPKGKSGRLLAHLNTSDPFFNNINDRIHEIMKLPLNLGEPLEIEKYVSGFNYEEHYDYFPVGLKSSEKELSKNGQRTWTFMIQLNNAKEVGNTPFKQIDREIYLSKGEVLLWNNLYPGGKENPYTKHINLSVESGEKYTLTKWFRQGVNTPPIEEKSNVVEISIENIDDIKNN